MSRFIKTTSGYNIATALATAREQGRVKGRALASAPDEGEGINSTARKL